MDSDLLFSLIAVAILLIISGFFSGSETGLTAVSRARIFQLMKEGNPRAALVSKLRQNKESLIGAILLGNNLVNILASALMTNVAISLFGTAGVVYATLAMTLLVLIFSEVLPKTYAIKRSEQVSLAVAPLLTLVVKVFYPFTQAVKWLIGRIFALFGIDVSEENAFLSVTDVLRGTIEMHHEQGQMEKQDRDMLGSILELEEIEVEEVMVHRTKIQALDFSAPVDQIIKEAIDSPHSRLPIYRGDYNEIIGILHIKRLIALLHSKDRAEITHKDLRATFMKPWFIPSTTSLKDQLYAFREKKQHFAMVVDEYGALLGVVTLEDVIEEIVGEIDDETDRDEGQGLSGIVELTEHSWLIEGNCGIRDLNRHFDWSLPDEEANTLAGLILQEARDIPQQGDDFTIGNYRFTVEARTPNQLTQIRVEALPATEA